MCIKSILKLVDWACTANGRWQPAGGSSCWRPWPRMCFTQVAAWGLAKCHTKPLIMMWMIISYHSIKKYNDWDKNWLDIGHLQYVLNSHRSSNKSNKIIYWGVNDMDIYYSINNYIIFTLLMNPRQQPISAWQWTSAVFTFFCAVFVAEAQLYALVSHVWLKMFIIFN